MSSSGSAQASSSSIQEEGGPDVTTTTTAEPASEDADESSFWHLVETGDVAKVRACLDHGPPPERLALSSSGQPDEWNALELASYHGHLPLVRWLWRPHWGPIPSADGHAAPQPPPEAFNHAINLAMGRGHFQIVNFLLNQVRPNAVLVSSQNKTNSDADPILTLLLNDQLQYVSYLESIFEQDFPFYFNEALEKLASSDRGRLCRILFQAIQAGQTSLLELMLDSGQVDVNCVLCQGGQGANQDGLSASTSASASPLLSAGDRPIHAAVQASNLEAVRLLVSIEEVELNQVNADDVTALILAVENKFLPAVKVMASSGRVDFNKRHTSLSRDYFGETPLHVAMRLGDPDTVKTLLEVDADFDSFTYNAAGQTPVQVTQDQALIKMVVQDKRFRPDGDLLLPTGESLLHMFCTLDPKDRFFYSKVDSLFTDAIDPNDKIEEILLANEKRNYYIVWNLLKNGPCSIDLEKIDFFKALVAGQRIDKGCKKTKSNIMHVFAANGYTEAIRHILTQYKPSHTVHKKLCSHLEDLYLSRLLSVDIKGNMPGMVAAKYNNNDALVLLLQPLLVRDASHNSELHDFLHHRNSKDHTLLYLVSHHQKSLLLPQAMILDLERKCHEGDKHGMQKCLRDTLGTSEMSRQPMEFIKAGDSQSCLSRWTDIGSHLVFSLLLPVGLMLTDMFTDALLIRDYYREWNDPDTVSRQLETQQICKQNRTLDCYASVPTGQLKFSISITIFFLPFLFYLVEMFKYFQFTKTFDQIRQARERFEPDSLMYRGYETYASYLSYIRHIPWYFRIVWLPFLLAIWITWPIRVFLFCFFYKVQVLYNYNYKKIDFYFSYLKAYQTYSARAHLIEASAEATLQPLLQFYLFLPTLVASLRGISLLPKLTVEDLVSTQAFQIYSVTFSILSLSFSFSSNYRKRKLDAMSMLEPGSLLYLAQNLCFALSRLLAFIMFAYSFAPGHFHYPMMFVLAHAVLMAILHGCMTNQPHARSKAPKCLKFLRVCYDSFLNGLANIYVHNNVESFEGHHSQFYKGTPIPQAVPAQKADRFLQKMISHCKGPAAPSNLDTTQSTFMRQALFDLIFGLENLAMVVTAFASKLYDVDPVFRDVLFSSTLTIVALFVLGVVLKVVYYSIVHLWSDLIVNNFERRFQLRCTSCFGQSPGGPTDVDETMQMNLIENQREKGNKNVSVI